MPVYNISGDSVLSSIAPKNIIRIAASNSTIGEKELADYVCTGSNDETVLQSAIDSLAARSGVIYLANGVYNIDSFTAHDGYYYGLYIPYSDKQIIIEGTNQNNRSVATGASFTAVDGNAVIKVSQSAYSALSSSDESYVIGTKRTRTFSYNNFSVNNVSIDIPDNQKPIIGIDTGYSTRASICGCYFTTHGQGDGNSVATNANPKCISLRIGVYNAVGFNNHYDHNKTVGWGTGYQILGDHVLMTDCLSQRNQYGFVFGNISALNNIGPVTTHPATLVGCCSEFNKKAALVFGTGTNQVEIVDLDMENYVDSTHPWYPDAVFTSEGTGWSGRISFSFKEPGGGAPFVHNPWDTVDHASLFETIDLAARKRGTTSQRPSSPCLMSMYYDTTVEKVIMWNGSAWVELS